MGGLPGNQPNHPGRAARAILALVDADQAPLHLPLGQDALGVVRKKIDGLQADLRAWEQVSASTGFEDRRETQAA